MDRAEYLTKHDLLSCVDLGKAMTSELNSEKLFTIILQKLTEFIPAMNWSLLLQDQETGELCFNICVGIDSCELKNLRLMPGEGIAGQVFENKKPMIVEDVSKSEFFTNRIDDFTGFETESVICVPLVFGGHSVGVLEAINPDSHDERVLAILELVADYAAIAVENMRRYHRIESMLNHDNLTGLYNTRFMYKNLEEIIEKDKEGIDKFSMIFMDIDNFKAVVDAHGHLNGSTAIQEIAETLDGTVQWPQYSVSYAGDEFVIVLPGFTKEEALEKAGEIRQRMNERVYLADENINVKISASFGVANYPDDADTLTGLMCLADNAMFSAKDAGKDGICGS